MELNGNSERLQRSYAELGELQLVLERASRFFEDDRSAARSSALQSSGAPDGAMSGQRVTPVFSLLCLHEHCCLG